MTAEQRAEDEPPAAADGDPTLNPPPPETEDVHSSPATPSPPPAPTPLRPAEPPEPQPFEISLARSLQSRSSNLLTTFLALDGDGDGYVGRTDLRTALHNCLGVDLTDDQADAIFARFAYFEDDGRDYDDEEDDSDGDKDDDKPMPKPKHRHHGIRYQEFVKYLTETASSSTVNPSSPYGSTLTLSPPSDPRRSSLEPIQLSPPRVAHDLRRSLARSIRSSGKSSRDLFLKVDSHRTGSITVDEFRDFVEGVGFMWTEEELMLALGEHYHPQRGVEYEEFVRAVEELEEPDGNDEDGDGRTAPTTLTTELGVHDDPHDDEMRRRGKVAADEADRRARELFGTALRRCADDSRTDAHIVRTIAERLYAKHTLLVDAFRKFDLDGTGRLSATELCEALTEAGGLDVSVDRAERLVRRFDADGDGKLSLSEFVKLMSSSGDDDWEERQETSSGDAGAARLPAEQGATAAARSDAVAPAPSSSTNASIVSAVLGHENDKSAKDKSMTAAAAEDDDGSLDEDDISAILRLREALETERVLARRAFQKFDRDMSRDLSPNELREGFERLGINVSQEHVDHIMHRFDPGETGSLKYYQFVKLLSADLGV